MHLRDQVYAHTDRTDARQVVDVSDAFGLASPAFTEGWHPIDREALLAITELARQLELSLASAVAERVAQLEAGRAGPDA